MNFLRWILFIPVGFVLCTILQLLPILLVMWARAHHFTPTWFNIILAIIFSSAALGIIGFWVMAVFMTPLLVCRGIAPNKRISSVIFATMVVLLEVWSLILFLNKGASFWLIGFHVVFSVIFMFGIVFVYKDD